MKNVYESLFTVKNRDKVSKRTRPQYIINNILYQVTAKSTVAITIKLDWKKPFKIKSSNLCISESYYIFQILFVRMA